MSGDDAIERVALRFASKAHIRADDGYVPKFGLTHQKSSQFAKGFRSFQRCSSTTRSPRRPTVPSDSTTSVRSRLNLIRKKQSRLWVYSNIPCSRYNPRSSAKTSSAKSGRLRRVAGLRASSPVTSIRCVIARGALSDPPLLIFLLCNCLLRNSGPRSLQLERYHMAPWPGEIGTRSEENVRKCRHRFPRINAACGLHPVSLTPA